jgi:hypothetical protein
VLHAGHACRELKAKTGTAGGELSICEDHALGLEEGLMALVGPGSGAFFERAEEVEDYKVRRSPLGSRAAAAADCPCVAGQRSIGRALRSLVQYTLEALAGTCFVCRGKLVAEGCSLCGMACVQVGH